MLSPAKLPEDRKPIAARLPQTKNTKNFNID